MAMHAPLNANVSGRNFNAANNRARKAGCSQA